MRISRFNLVVLKIDSAFGLFARVVRSLEALGLL